MFRGFTRLLEIRGQEYIAFLKNEGLLNLVLSKIMDGATTRKAISLSTGRLEFIVNYKLEEATQKEVSVSANPPSDEASSPVKRNTSGLPAENGDQSLTFSFSDKFISKLTPEKKEAIQKFMCEKECCTKRLKKIIDEIDYRTCLASMAAHYARSVLLQIFAAEPSVCYETMLNGN